MRFDLQIRNYFNLSTLNKDLCFPIIMNMLNTFGAEGRKSTSLATIRWVRKDVDLRPRKNFISWVRVSIQMLLQGRKIYVFVLCE